MRRLPWALALLLGLPLSLAACLWDRDTPADEAEGMPEVVAMLTGRFERNPLLFYEMRLARVADELQSDPGDLAAYDDAGVACDRLGRGDEAISWMERKRAQLENHDPADPETGEHLYRYHANLGTFLVHRWARAGADRSRIDEVKAARDHIAKAIEINPNAHFGREKYQLQALEWIIDLPKAEGRPYLPNLLGWPPYGYSSDQIDPKDADDAVHGLAGLVVLGNAWESVDVFNALKVALELDSLDFGALPNGGRNNLAYLAWLRCNELIDVGKGSMLPDAPKGQALKPLLPKPDFIDADKLLDPVYKQLRAEADAWHAARATFMTKRLNEGRHPDTDPDFWTGYTEPPAPSLPAQSVPDAYSASLAARKRLILSAVIGLPLFAAALVGLLHLNRSLKSRRKKTLPPQHPLADSRDDLS